MINSTRYCKFKYNVTSIFIKQTVNMILIYEPIP